MSETIWWERRRPNERTVTYLSRVIRELGLTDLAEKAEHGHYDDYFCPDECDDNGDNMLRLTHDLDSVACSATRDQRLMIRAVSQAAKNGEFDGTREESEEWFNTSEGRLMARFAESPDGQALINKVFGKKMK